MAFEFDANSARPEDQFDPTTAKPEKPAGALRKLGIWAYPPPKA